MTLAEVLIALTFVVSIETPVEIQAGWENAGHTGTTGGAWAEWDRKSNPPTGCVIHVPPLTDKTLAIWLHEIRHCREGHWH